MQRQINFNIDQILPSRTRNRLTSFTNAGLQAFDYTTYTTQITSQISTLAVDNTISTLEQIRDRLRLPAVSIRF